jgi:hypothetical protein
MPRFYCDFHDGAKLMPGEVGSELSSLEAAEHTATQTILQLGRHWLPEARELSIAVRDEQDRPVLTRHTTLWDRTTNPLYPALGTGHAGAICQHRRCGNGVHWMESLP